MCMTRTELEKKVAELRNLKAMKEELENEVNVDRVCKNIILLK